MKKKHYAVCYHCGRIMQVPTKQEADRKLWNCPDCRNLREDEW